MAVKNWDEIEKLFHAARRLERGARAAYLERVCPGDETSRAEVESLIAASEGREDFLEEPAFSLGLKVMSDETSASLVGELIGPYRILKPLGKGGMGEVYVAEDTRLERKVALKFLSTRLVDDNWAKRQLVKEAQAVAMLDHPNICAVHGIEEADGHNFIVMQYVEGETLADVIHEQLPDVKQAVSLSVQIASAIAAAHAHGIIHRDIKPPNIMVTAGGQVKVLDFGLAKIVQRKDVKALTDDSSQFTQDGLVVGTMAYMSPEQLRAERLDFRSDIFSFGAVLYELVSGKKPFMRESDAEVISAILTSRPAPLTRTTGEISPELNRIIFKCLEKNKEQRYQSASELLHDLDTLQQNLKNGAQWGQYFSFRLAAAFALVLLFIAVSAFIYHRMNRIRTLAVLPIHNESAEANLEYLGDGLPDSLINRLSRLPKLRVKAFTAVSGYKGRSVEPQRIGRELNVDAVLTGTIARQGDLFVLQVNLIDTTDGAQLWGERYELKSAAIVNVHEQISDQVAANLGLRTGASEQKALAASETENEEAFRQYLRGRHYWRFRNQENIVKAIEHFNAAIRIDPAYARAYAGLADCYVLLNTTAYGNMRTEEAMNRARAAAKQALEIDNSLAEAHTSLGAVHMKYDWDWAEAEKQFKQAVSLNPDYAPAHYWYSSLLAITGRQAEAMAESEVAKNLDPFSSSTRINFCRSFYFGRRYESAASCLNEMLKEDPENINAQYVLGFVLEQQGMHDETLKIFERLYAKNEKTKRMMVAALGYAYGRAGRKAEALKLLAEAEELYRRTDLPPQELAVIYMGLDDKDQAFKWLEKAYEEHFASLIFLTTDPAFNSLRADARFDDLARRLKLTTVQPPSNLTARQLGQLP